ncbi:MAG: hypothetical protein GWN84_21135, partial [Gammaproteobacteria bacterium]|nr:hypothetical protein [Gammaproteobacteria bacterium]
MMTEFFVLSRVNEQIRRRADTSGAAPLQNEEIAQDLGMTPRAIEQSIGRLVQRRLLIKEPNPDALACAHRGYR